MSTAPGQAAATRPRRRSLRRPSRAGVLAVVAPGLALALLLLASILLRTTAMHGRYWIDEGLSVGIASHGFLDIPGVLRQDGSPPLYYLLLSVWVQLFGIGEAHTHMLSLLFALATVPVAFVAGRELFDQRTGLVAAALAALNPYLTYYAQETRMYALASLLGLIVAGSFGLVYAERRRRWLPVFSISLALLVYTHNWGLFLTVGTLVALVVLWALSRSRRALLRDAVIGYGAVGLLYLPWLPSLVFQARNTGAPWSEEPEAHQVLDGLTSLLGGPAPAMAFGLAVGAGLVTLVTRGREGADAARRRAGVALLTLLVIGLATAWGMSQISPAWATRYFAVFVGPVLLLGAFGLTRAGRLGLVVMAILALFWVQQPRTGQLSSKSNAHEAAVDVKSLLKPNDLVVDVHPEQGPVMHLYLSRMAPAVPLRWADSMGPVGDPQIFDWRNALDRLRAARPTPTADALIRTLAPGQHLLLVQPIIRTARWGAPWTELVRRRAGQWQRVLDRDDRLVRVITAPKLGGRPLPRGVRTVLYLRL